jgi:hypothetical protein
LSIIVLLILVSLFLGGVIEVSYSGLAPSKMCR